MSRNNNRGPSHARGQAPGNRGGRGYRGGRPAQNSRFADYSQQIFDTDFAIDATEDVVVMDFINTEQLSGPSNNNGYARGQSGQGRGRGDRGFNQGNNRGFNRGSIPSRGFNQGNNRGLVSSRGFNQGNGRGFNRGPIPSRGFIPPIRGNVNGRGRGRGFFKPYNPLPVVMGPPPSDFTPVPALPNQSGSKIKGKGKLNDNHAVNSSKAVRGRAGGLGFKSIEERPKILNPHNRPLLIPPVFVRAKERLFDVDPEELLRAHEVPPHAIDQLDPQTDLLAAAFEDRDDETKQRQQSTGVNTSGQDTPAYEEDIVAVEEIELTIEDYDNEKMTHSHISSRMVNGENDLSQDHHKIVTDNDLLNAVRDAAEIAHSQDAQLTPSPGGDFRITETTETLFFFDSTGSQNPSVHGTEQVPIYDKAYAPVLREENDEPDEIVLVPSLTARRSASNASPKSRAETAISSASEGTRISAAHPTASTLPIQPDHVGPALTMETLHLSFDKASASTRPNQSLSSFSVPQSSRSARVRVPVRARKEAKRSKSKRKRGSNDTWTNDLGNVFGFKDGREGLRKGDSDLDVASASEREEGSVEDGGMDVDEDLDPVSMANFAMNINRQHMSAHDIEIEEAIKRGGISSEGEDNDEDQSENGSESASEIKDENSEEDEDVEEKIEIHEAIFMDESDSSWDDEDPDISSNTKFTHRIQKIRERTPGHSDLTQFNSRSKADEDEDFIAEIEETMDQNGHILTSRDRKGRKEVLFRAIRDGDPDHPFGAMTSRAGHVKDRADILAEQWQKDRNKKAEWKRLREEQRLAQGGLGNGKVKGQKQKNQQIPDLEEIEQMMWDLIASKSKSTSKSFSLPALPKPVRERVHAMAQVFQLKSTSSGKKKAEIKTMTISLTKRTTAVAINERKLNSVMRRKGGRGAGGAIGVHGIKEGEVIGHKAEKISQENIGYRLLAQMGWSEGDRIGLEGGLVDPLTAVMKKSKLGLGASRAV